jgi:hypothetical protein
MTLTGEGIYFIKGLKDPFFTMNILKIITILNWIVIALLGFLVAAETLFPTKGGEAAGRGM